MQCSTVPWAVGRGASCRAVKDLLVMGELTSLRDVTVTFGPNSRNQTQKGAVEVEIKITIRRNHSKYHALVLKINLTE